MGGKNLKFPKRKKFVSEKSNIEQKEKEQITADEHEKRLKMLKDMGLLK